MLRARRRIVFTIVGLFLLFLVVWAFAPAERVDRTISFDENTLPADLEIYLAQAELQLSDITPGTEKRIVWAGAPGATTALSVIYLHGFSASAQEIRPVPDEVAKALGANLYFARLAGHGRGGDALAEPEAGDWLEDTAEALAIGRRLGERVIIIGTSTGATLAAFAAVDADMADRVAGIVMISPNFGLRGAAAVILDLPLARWWGPLIAGGTRSYGPVNADNGRYWTTSYPTVALFPMAALTRVARSLDYGKARMPLLLIWSPQDQVIDTARIAPVAAAWGGPVTEVRREMTAGDDAYAHVIAGDILSPGQTEPVIAEILDWARGL